MTAAELLKPRFEVIAEYPNCLFEKGTILVQCERKGWFNDPKTGVFLFQEHNLTPYPHLFKPLNWWEYRKVEDMPKKVISNRPKDKGKIMDVEKWNLDDYIVFFDTQKRRYCVFIDWDSENCFLPID